MKNKTHQKQHLRTIIDCIKVNEDKCPLSSSIIYIPPILGDSTQIVAFFKGCLRGLTFNDQDMPFATATDNATSVSRNSIFNVTSGVFHSSATDNGFSVAPVGLVSGCLGDKVCRVNPCPKNSYCVDAWNLASCPCLVGWEGVYCNKSVDDCRTNLCQNGAVCVDDHVSYTCICPDDRYTGRYCDVLRNPCVNDPPCNSTTTASCDAFNETSVICTCKPGYAGVFCDDVIDNCSPSPCLNNGSCRNAPNRFTCECPKGYFGTVCEERDPCLSEPCFNGGICTAQSRLLNISSSSSSSSSSTSLSTLGSLNNTGTISSSSSSNSSTAISSPPFQCECRQPYYGSVCQNYDFCVGNMCRNNASCIVEQNRPTCQCPFGYYGTFCEFEDHCASLPCQHNAECRNEADTHICLCPFYFTGKNCETAINQCEFNLCFNGATCIFNESTVREAFGSSSSLSSGLILSSSSATSDQNNALPSNSQQTAVSSESRPTALAAATSKSPSNLVEVFINSTYCICSPGFGGDNCQVDVNECDSNPCLNNGSCRDSTNRHPGEGFFVGFRLVSELRLFTLLFR